MCWWSGGNVDHCHGGDDSNGALRLCNIDTHLLQVPEHELFETVDLFEEKDMTVGAPLTAPTRHFATKNSCDF